MTDVVVALDVGGTGIKSALVRRDGAVHHAERHPTGAHAGPAAVIDTIVSIADGLARRARDEGLRPVGLGVAVPGVIDEAAGVAVWSANLGFREVPLRDLLAERVGLATALGHDVRAGGLAEVRLGAAQDCRYVLFVAIGTGIAAAQVVDGVALAGAHGAAGEIGHIVVRPGGPRCGCGQFGCLEAVASAAALGRRYTELVGTPVTAADLAAHAAAGDTKAADLWQDAVEALADGLLLAQTMYDTEVMVIGGGLSEAGAYLLDPLRVALRDRLTFHREPRLVRAALGDGAGRLGAALLALDSLEAP